MSECSRVNFDQPLEHWLTGGKEGKYKKIDILRIKKKSYLDKIKGMFHNFSRAIIK